MKLTLKSPAKSTLQPVVKEFFDKATWTLTYVVYDPDTRDALVIDPVWDYDPAASKMSQDSAAEVLNFIQAQNLQVHYILETHAHADHVSGSQVLKRNLPKAQIGIGARITDVQKVFKNVFNLAADFKTDGSQFDLLLEEGKPLHAGALTVETLYTPGHTPACGTYIIGDAVFTGDALFMPDYGTGRCDFPAGSADDLYSSVQKIYQLPDHYRVFVGHDYMPNGRELAFQSTIQEQKEQNIQLKSNTSREQFVSFRNARDKTLAAPRLLLPSVQVNIDAGHLPQPEDNGTKYLKIPIKE
ncbi:MBL fold metallo-hydrolase [Pseudobdellovibrio exovorus]|uniref:Metallo-beta-lactamase superfamily protein n=1 Tax=Pseudobdellovibrio exovorus JSS TaxID=1184267 RepID=M4V910_9BACT|nr:MBL fold metallo-hydrolase [Pseudobdellovibrio exovorus]AGH94486.1 metallo-beta-lactamase superfamily protein [Pseudobdellovibrio exovorus JSS]